MLREKLNFISILVIPNLFGLVFVCFYDSFENHPGKKRLGDIYIHTLILMGIGINFVVSDQARVLRPHSGQRGRPAWQEGTCQMRTSQCLLVTKLTFTRGL